MAKDSRDCRVAWVKLDNFEELPGSPEIETFPTVIGSFLIKKFF